ncbi:hypothetical protein [uncultured Parasphingopyxis sp.]|uniref:hypothetical protein n=1 Tax=uncultured Parasphingopyxis sp. TaxID=1547918 RepID=UPI00261431AC|nr:hypothetical protein [uncultured Parasphingopyxis sp.]
MREHVLMAMGLAMAAVASAPASAQQVTDPNMEVDSLTLEPGDAVIFGFGEGFDHQLLLIRHRGAEAISEPLSPGEVRAVLYVDDGASWLDMENATSERLTFDGLADRRGQGGYSTVPTRSVAPGGRAEAGRWDFPIYSLVIGEFSYGPHGDHAH